MNFSIFSFSLQSKSAESCIRECIILFVSNVLFDFCIAMQLKEYINIKWKFATNDKVFPYAITHKRKLQMDRDDNKSECRHGGNAVSYAICMFCIHSLQRIVLMSVGLSFAFGSFFHYPSLLLYLFIILRRFDRNFISQVNDVVLAFKLQC